MSTIVDVPPNRHLLSIEDYEKAWRAGVFGIDVKVELLDGEVFDKVSPQNYRHSLAVMACVRFLTRAAGVGRVWVQLPVDVPQFSQPEPDVMVTRKDFDFYPSRPTSSEAVLIVEVSDSTLAVDRNLKTPLYAAGGVDEYWIVNLQGRTLEVNREPIQTEEGWRFRSVQILSKDQDVAPLFAPEQVTAVSSLMPGKD
jgi:Uma2 family endonuclease